MEGFMMTPFMGAVLFRYFVRYGVTGAAARTEIVRRLVKKHKARYLRDPQAFMEGKNVIGFKPKETE